MPGRLPIVYWDSCVFIAWLKDEDRASGEMAGLHSVAKEVYANKKAIITSVQTQTEILESKIGHEEYARFEAFLNRSNVQVINVDGRIANLAMKIRDHYSQQDVKIETPDATHLATAILYKAPTFHTFDEDDLIPISGNVAGHNLKIEKPSGKQLGFDLPRKSRSDEEDDQNEEGEEQ